MVPADRYGAARMMKDAGVDRLSLAKRLGELDPGQLDTFASIYARQAAIVALRVDECRFAESFLVQRAFSLSLEDELIASIPTSKEKLAELGGGPQAPFENAADPAALLRAIAANSPVRLTRTLAQIARIGRGDVDEASWTAARASTSYGYGPIAIEGAFALVRPSVRAVSAEWKRDSGWVLPHLDHDALAKIGEIARVALADERLAPWAAVAVALAIDLPSRIPWHAEHAAAMAEREKIHDALMRGLDSGDPELRFAAALALRDPARLEPELASGDARRVALAQTALAKPGGTHAPVVLADMSAHAYDSETGNAAGCAIAAMGSADRKVMERLLSATFQDEASEERTISALAFGNWRVRASGALWVDGRAMQRLITLAEPLLADRARGPYAAVLLSQPLTEELSRRDWSGHEEAKRRLGELAPVLRDGLSSRDDDLAFACALALRDEAALASAIDSPNAGMAKLAREAVGSTQSNLVHRIFRTGTDDARREAIRAVHHPVDEPTMRAILDGILASAPPPEGRPQDRRDTFRERGLDFLHSGIRFEQHPPEIRAMIGTFFRDNATALWPDRLLAVVDWACSATSEHGSNYRPRGDAEITVYVEAATRALEAAPKEKRAALIESHYGWPAWLYNAGDSAARILNEWVLDTAITEKIFDRIHSLHGHINSYGETKDARAQTLMVTIWNDIGPDGQLVVAPVLADLLRGAAQHREGYFAAFWDRFKTIPGERDALLVLLSSFRRELEEASANDGVPLAGADPAKSFRLQYQTDPSSVYELTKRAVTDLKTEAAAPVIAACCEAAHDYVLENVLTGLACFEVLAEWVCQRVIDEKGSEASAALNAQVDAGYKATRTKAIDGLPANKTKEHYFESKCECIDAALAKGQLEVERMAREAAREIEEAADEERRIADAAREEREREIANERARKDAEEEVARMKADIEQRVREATEDAQRAMRAAQAESERLMKAARDGAEQQARIEAERQAEERLRAVAIPVDVASRGAPLELEVLLPGQPLQTLADYVGFMKALSGGANAMDLMSKHGMDVQKYSACAIAWGQLMTSRSDVAVRFGQLMQAPR